MPTDRRLIAQAVAGGILCAVLVAAFVLLMADPRPLEHMTRSLPPITSETFEIVTNPETGRPQWKLTWVDTATGALLTTRRLSSKDANIFDRPVLLARGIPFAFALGFLGVLGVFYVLGTIDWWWSSNQGQHRRPLDL
jgi:hypothetical protein